ncbi:hypothetical protein Agabi119p4_224 [Agaricus bisporus var. burnettii]|uniref:Uncharacterized protein n=1 Tax=Agaricus bisporus var. burnettii TaxID=192524 RepID=A0A8H7KKY0_AGABI|nr:hypothetical protein Agabi119p4_224 [Agaricus bisporus var. burnettii]
MSSALRAEQQPRTWWSLSPKSSKQELNRPYLPPLPSNRYHVSDSTLPSPSKSPARAFPSFASIIGFKSKKHPVLAIQDPPPLISCPPSRVRRGIPAQLSQLQSPTLPLSPADSNELVSSPDHERRQSLLTLSDTDPFAVRGIAVHSHSTTHSNNSFLDVSKHDKHSFYARASSSSSSSNSHSPHDSHASNSLRAQNPNSHQKTLSASKSLSNIHKNAKQADSEIHGTRSQPNSRPPTRSRGMTQSSPKPPSLQEGYIKPRSRCPSSPAGPPAAGPGPALLASVPLDPHTRPSSRPSSAGHTSPPSTVPIMRIQTISRQTSFQRFQPPTAPPTFELPPPPKVSEEPALENDFDISPACNQSFSSSNLSFDSSLSLSRGSTGKETSDGDNWSFVTNLRPDYESEINHRMKPSLDIITSPQLLRAHSHPSPDQRFPAGASLASVSEQSAAESPPKVIKKQRSHHRLGLPPISLGCKNRQAANVPSLPVPTTTEQRRGDHFNHTSTSVMPTRKRVFSGSSIRRPSTSSGIPSYEDDARSLFSVRSDHEIFTNASPFKPWPIDMSASVSCWDDQSLLSPVRSEYTPQQIMSPEDQAKVEAELDDASIASALTPSTFPLSPARSRATSMSTVFSDRDSEIIPSSVFSMPISESKSIRSPQISTKSLMVEFGDGVGTSVGRRASQARPKPIYQPSRRPSTASGVSSVGFVSSKQTIQSATSEFDTSVTDTSSQATTAITPTASVFPPSIRQPQRKGSDVSSKPLTVQVQSLPPPPRPRAKAEVVINTHTQSQSPVNPSLEAGVETSIGIDFGHQRQGHAVSPSIQSVNGSFSIRSGSSQNRSPRIPHLPPVPPKASTRPAPISSRRTRIGGQQPPPVAMNNGTKLSRRISLQRKPSFLDISDNDDDDEVSDENLNLRPVMRINRTHSSDSASFSRSTYSTASVAESFLEFGRDSFDTSSDQDQ